MSQNNVVPRYKVWFDKRSGRLTTYNRHWKKEDWESLVYIGELQPNQNPFKMNENGIYRMLYGQMRYYYCFRYYQGRIAEVNKI